MSIRSFIYTILCLIATVALQSCGTSYPGIEYVFDGDGESGENNEMVKTYPINVSLNFISLFYTNDRPNTSDTPVGDENDKENVNDNDGSNDGALNTDATRQGDITRGGGAFDRINYSVTYKDLYMASRFYTLAMRRTLPSAGNLAYSPKFSTRYTDGSNDAHQDVLVGSEWSGGQHPGKLSRPKGLEGQLAFIDDQGGTTNTPLEWNPDYNKIGYNFFGYYLDDAKVDAIRPSDDRIEYDITIDGTQDIMVGFSPSLTYSYLETKYPHVEQQYYDELLFNGSGGYSLYGATFGVNPIIDINHMLTRLKLNIMLMEDTKDEAGMAPDITFKSLRVKAKDKLSLCVASKNLSEVGLTNTSGETWFDIHETPSIINGDRVPGGIVPSKKLEYLVNNSIGESFLLVPEDEYELELVYEQKLMTKYNIDDPAHPEYEVKTYRIVVPVRPNNIGGFLPGNIYYATLRMWGAQRIDVVVSNQAWQNGGNVNIEFDEDIIF